MSEEAIIQTVVIIGSIVAGFATVKNDTSWLKRILSTHLEDDRAKHAALDARIDKAMEK